MTGEPQTQRLTRLTPVGDVLARIDALVKAVAPGEVGIAAAIGCILAHDLVLDPRPASPIALRDGWAVRSELTLDASAYTPAPLPTAIRIETGGLLPAGVDAVAPPDGVSVRHGRAEAVTPVVAGEGVLPAGADAGRGATLGHVGQRLGPLQVAVLTAAGRERISVRAPRVRLVRARARPDHILSAVCSLIARAVAAEGGVTEGEGPADLAAALEDTHADAIVAVGGTGSGRNDASVHTLARLGRVEAHGIALSPGETAAFGVAGTRPVLLLPGRVDAALAVWLMLGRRMLARLSGGSEHHLSSMAVLTRKIASPLGLAEVVPVRCRAGKAEPLASGYWPLHALAQADGWVLVPADSEGYPAGAEVMVRAWP
jgi:molybdopterin biosynthesis enzyme